MPAKSKAAKLLEKARERVKEKAKTRVGAARKLVARVRSARGTTTRSAPYATSSSTINIPGINLSFALPQMNGPGRAVAAAEPAMPPPAPVMLPPTVARHLLPRAQFKGFEGEEEPPAIRAARRILRPAAELLRMRTGGSVTPADTDSQLPTPESRGGGGGGGGPRGPLSMAVKVPEFDARKLGENYEAPTRKMDTDPFAGTTRILPPTTLKGARATVNKYHTRGVPLFGVPTLSTRDARMVESLARGLSTYTRRGTEEAAAAAEEVEQEQEAMEQAQEAAAPPQPQAMRPLKTQRNTMAKYISRGRRLLAQRTSGGDGSTRILPAPIPLAEGMGQETAERIQAAGAARADVETQILPPAPAPMSAPAPPDMGGTTQLLPPTGDTTRILPPAASTGDTTQILPPVAPTGDTTRILPPVAPTGDTTRILPPVTLSREEARAQRAIHEKAGRDAYRRATEEQARAAEAAATRTLPTIILTPGLDVAEAERIQAAGAAVADAETLILPPATEPFTAGGADAGDGAGPKKPPLRERIRQRNKERTQLKRQELVASRRPTVTPEPDEFGGADDLPAPEAERAVTAGMALELARGIETARERAERERLQLLDKAGQRAEQPRLYHKEREGDAVFEASTAGVRVREEAAGAPPTYSDEPVAKDPFG